MLYKKNSSECIRLNNKAANLLCVMKNFIQKLLFLLFAACDYLRWLIGRCETIAGNMICIDGIYSSANKLYALRRLLLKLTNNEAEMCSYLHRLDLDSQQDIARPPPQRFCSIQAYNNIERLLP